MYAIHVSLAIRHMPHLSCGVCCREKWAKCKRHPICDESCGWFLSFCSNFCCDLLAEHVETITARAIVTCDPSVR